MTIKRGSDAVRHHFVVGVGNASSRTVLVEHQGHWPRLRVDIYGQDLLARVLLKLFNHLWLVLIRRARHRHLVLRILLNLVLFTTTTTFLLLFQPQILHLQLLVLLLLR